MISPLMAMENSSAPWVALPFCNWQWKTVHGEVLRLWPYSLIVCVFYCLYIPPIRILLFLSTERKKRHLFTSAFFHTFIKITAVESKQQFLKCINPVKSYYHRKTMIGPKTLDQFLQMLFPPYCLPHPQHNNIIRRQHAGVRKKEDNMLFHPAHHPS